MLPFHSTVIVTCKPGRQCTVNPPFCHKNCRFIDIFWDSIKRMNFTKAITAKFKVHIQGSLCSFSDTAFSRHMIKIDLLFFIFKLGELSIPPAFWRLKYMFCLKIHCESCKMHKKLDILAIEYEILLEDVS